MVFKTTAFDRSATSPFIFKVLFYSVSGRFKTFIIYQMKPSLVALWSHYLQAALSGHSLCNLLNGFYIHFNDLDQFQNQYQSIPLISNGY